MKSNFEFKAKTQQIITPVVTTLFIAKFKTL